MAADQIMSLEGDWKEDKSGDLVLKVGRKKYDVYCGEDHRAAPDDVVHAVNGVLELIKAPYKFVHINTGDDSYWFGLVDLNGKPVKAPPGK